MHGTAEAHSVTLDTSRNCTVEITNVSSVFRLENPKVHMQKGFSYNPPQPTIRVGKTEVCSFVMDDHTATGSVGVLTYELHNIQTNHYNELIAVMFSVPFDYNFYKNWLAVGIFESTRACDESLYDLMYNEKDFTNFARQEANGTGVVHEGRVVDLRACMSDDGRAIVKLEVYDKLQ